MVEINIEKPIPDTAGEGIGKGAENLGEGVGKGAEAFGNGIQSFGQGAGYFLACLGDRIKYGKAFQQYPMATQLLVNSGNSKLLEVARSLPLNQEQPKTLVDSIQYEEEKNLRQFIKNLVEETFEREKLKEQLPKDFHDTGNLLAIKKAAAETNDDDLSKMWARLFVEEATHPDSVSKASIDILKKLDKKTATILQEQIFPYCTDDGWFLETNDKCIPARMVASDYGILYDYGIAKTLTKCVHPFEKKFCSLDFGSCLIWGHLGYNFFTKNHLTESALHIKNVLKIFPNDTHLNEVANFINDEKFWHLSDEYTVKKQPDKQDYAIIIKKDDMRILYPQNTYTNYMDYFSKINTNVEEKNSAEKQQQEHKND